jgi:cobalt-zinc-cadmium efflux system outer membrane protein
MNTSQLARGASGKPLRASQGKSSARRTKTGRDPFAPTWACGLAPPGPLILTFRQLLGFLLRLWCDRGLVLRWEAALCATLGTVTAGCAVHKYKPIPISAAQTAASLESRTLHEEGLRAFVAMALGHPISWPPKQWDLRLTTLAAFYFNPSLAVARAQVQTARAAIATAKMRPNPVLEFSPGVPSPYLIGLSLAFPLVTAHKREHQIELAKKLSQVAEINLAEAAWKVRGSVRAALLSYLIAGHNLSLTHTDEQLWSTRLMRLSQQLTAGEIPRPQVDTARIALLNARLAASAAEGRVLETRSALAAAIGIPVSGLEDASFTWPDVQRIPSIAALSARQIQRDAVLNRLDVRRALAEYSAAQNALQLELARQYPNVQLGPGYAYEERQSYFAPLFSIPLPVLNRNQGPIAQAEARRREAAASFLATQASVIAQSEQALAQYRASYEESQTARAVLANLRLVRVPMTRQEVRVGETDWLSLNSVLLQRSVAAQVWVNSIFQAQAALGQLEQAVEKPLEPADATPLVLRATSRTESPETAPP